MKKVSFNYLVQPPIDLAKKMQSNKEEVKLKKR